MIVPDTSPHPPEFSGIPERTGKRCFSSSSFLPCPDYSHSIFYCNQRGIPTEEAVGLIVNGYAKDVLNKLPMEFAVEAQKLLSVSLEGTVG